MVKFKYVFLAMTLAILLFCSSLQAMGERDYRLRARHLNAFSVFTSSELQQALQQQPNRTLELRGQVSGLLASSDRKILMLRLSDGSSAEISASYLPTDIQSGVRVCCLARSEQGPSSGPLTLEGITIDTGSPPLGRRHQSVSPSSRGRSLPSLPSRGSDTVYLRCRRAIVYFNPKLPAEDADLIASSIVHFSEQEGIDPYFAVAVVAAESRFNPHARSYKGAMGLGQLMPGTARGMGVSNPYDPVENLAAAIRILRGHLEKYQGQPYQTALTLAAYNAGSGAVSKHGGVPPYRETRNYIWKVYEYYCWLHGIPAERRPQK
jgi:hypothetical protein